MDEIRNWIARPINEHLRLLRLADAGVDPTAVQDLFDWITPAGMGLVSQDAVTGGVTEAQRSTELQTIIVPAATMMLLFLLVMFGAIPQLQAVMEEKSQRIVEVILSSVRPFEFMMGKVVGGLAVSLTASSIYVVAAAVILGRLGMPEFVPFRALPWFFTYAIIAILMYGAFLAALGSVCNNPTEAQSVTFPAMIPMLVPMFLMMPIILEPHGRMATVLSLVPPFTPFLMLLRHATSGGVPAWQAGVGLTGAVLFCVFLIWTSGRVFRVAILMQGTPPTLKNILRWAVRG